MKNPSEQSHICFTSASVFFCGNACTTQAQHMPHKELFFKENKSTTIPACWNMKAFPKDLFDN